MNARILPLSLRLPCLALMSAFVLAGCGADEADGAKKTAVPETPWEQVKAEAARPGDPKFAEKMRRWEADLAQATFPVLVPDDEAVLSRLELNVKSHLASVLAVFATHRVQMTAVRSGRADAPDAVALRKDRAELEFVRWGTTYKISVVCAGASGPDPAPCADDKLVRALRASLVWANPR
ncbi:MAG TPA: hypothetical protein DIT64_18815 [Verrucomicrobiales bacterium]|nr:hypothetical protein [Verrucomicrobiales bacterium]